MSSRIKQLVVNQDGPTTAEYAVMLALIIVVCIVVITVLGSSANTVFTNAAGSLP